MHYQFKQDLAMAYFDDCSKKTASRLLAREINLTPGLLDALRPTGNPERELSTAEKNQLKRRTAPPKNASPPANSKSSSPSSESRKQIPPPNTTEGETSRPRPRFFYHRIKSPPKLDNFFLLRYIYIKKVMNKNKKRKEVLTWTTSIYSCKHLT